MKGRLCRLCKKDSENNRCSRCDIACYCSKECQLIDWPSHKTMCIPFSRRQFTILNPRADRDIKIHAADHPQVFEMTKPINKFLSEILKLNPDTAAIMMIPPKAEIPLGQYGRCYSNVDTVIQTRGGKSVDGWMLFESTHAIESEAHCVWVPPDQPIFVNPTPSMNGESLSTFFCPDPNVTKFRYSNVKYLYWK